MCGVPCECTNPGGELSSSQAPIRERAWAKVLLARLVPKSKKEKNMKDANRRRLVAGLMLSACSSARPVLYPNAQLESVGKDAAEQDIEACRQLAESAGAENGEW